jgi:hypothetical protein
MSTTTLTISSAMNGPSSSSSSIHSTSALTQTSVAIPTRTATIQPTTPPTTTSTPLASRPSTPSTPAATLPKSSSSHTASADKLRLNRLSHISVATWVGVGLTLAGLVVAVYYGIPMMRLAIWTAKNDFREACKSELEAALPQTPACNKALEHPPQPPPIKKRGITVVRRHGLGLGFSVLVTCCLLLVLLFNVSKTLIQRSRKDSKQNKTFVRSNTPMHDTSERDALILCLLDTAQRLQMENADWELPAELKVKLIAMIEQSGTRERTSMTPPTQQASSRGGTVAATLYTSISTTLSTSTIKCNVRLAALMKLYRVIRSTIDNVVHRTRAGLMLCWIVRLRMPIALSTVLFICSYICAEIYPHQSSGTSQWSSVWESMRIMLLITVSYEPFMLELANIRQRVTLRLSIVLCAILMACNHFMNTVIANMGKEEWAQATGIISICGGALSLLMFSSFYLIGASCDVEELPQLFPVLPVLFTVLTIGFDIGLILNRVVKSTLP